jgi:hypothetical protein
VLCYLKYIFQFLFCFKVDNWISVSLPKSSDVTPISMMKIVTQLTFLEALLPTLESWNFIAGQVKL